ncbi:hypothetical protein ACSFBF_06900 [Variovorax sp. ZT5P49]|uniref:hypothetical protein n=1 Tax=Variovorax sp. ZT5P49 TaxID=3443733 RepID=UPI003F47A1F2
MRKLDAEPRLNGVSPTVMEWARLVAQVVNTAVDLLQIIADYFVNGVLGIVNGGTGATTAAGARANLGLGSAGSAGGRNLVDNRTFIVNQRNKAGTVVLAAGAYGHDRWKAGASGCTYTFAASGNDIVITITAGSLLQIIDAGAIEGGTYSMSWFGTAQGKIAGGSYGASGITAAGVAANAAMTIEFNTGTLSRVQVEPGATVTTFERRLADAELIRCQRRYETGSGELQAYNSAGNGTAVRIPFKVTKATTPVALTYTVAASTNCNVFDARTSTVDGLTWFATPIATGTIAWIGAWTASCEP